MVRVLTFMLLFTIQIEPPVFSETAKEYGLKKSLLERFHDHAEYSTEMGQLCKVVLTANYRSHPQVNYSGTSSLTYTIME